MAMRKLLSLTLALLLAACGKAQPQRAEFTLTYATPYPPKHHFSQADLEWMKYVEAESGGRIAFRPYWSGALLSSDMSMVEIRHGLADIGLITPIYARGGAHMLRAQSGFYGGVKDIDDQVLVYDCLAAKFPIFRQELKGLHVLAAQGGNFPGVLTRSRPVRSLADFKGLRLRAQVDSIEMLRALGADPVTMPMSEVYSALAKGVIDGVVAPADAIKSQHFAEVAHHFTTLRISRGAYPARAISDTAWKRLPPDLQDLLARSKPVWEAALNRRLIKAEADGFDYARRENVEVISLPVVDQARFDELSHRYAINQARRLSAYGLDGEAVLAEAQHLIRSGATSCVPPTMGVTK